MNYKTVDRTVINLKFSMIVGYLTDVRATAEVIIKKDLYVK